jgi:hypothetical protein
LDKPFPTYIIGNSHQYPNNSPIWERRRRAFREHKDVKKCTLAALVLALAHLETAVSGFSTLKNDTELCLRARESNAFHLHCYV